MAELYRGRVVRLGVDCGVDGVNARVLERLLGELHGVEGFAVEADVGVLTVYLNDSDADEDALVDALKGTGIFPLHEDVPGQGREVGFGAC